MLENQSHRGPDAQETWNDKDCYLGHNRLSILDLSENANQPMLSNCGRFVLVFNGEIYNYVELKKLTNYSFRTNSDSEVLLALYIRYGIKMLDYLNGMFAFAIWDRENHELFAARDRFGVKPFYYSINNGQFLFASEIKSLISAGADSTPNELVWADYLVNGSYGFPDESFYKQIKQLPAGHKLTINSADLKIDVSSYYDFVSRVEEQKVYENPKRLQNDYLELLLDSISLRFRSDVPVGFNVSGGLDSSILLSMISKVKEGHTEAIEAFTFFTGDSRYDELPWVKNLIEKTNSPLNSVLLRAEEIPALIEKVSFYQDEPFGGFPTLAYSKLFERARAKGIICLLDGQGMDEAWAGYDYYIDNFSSIVQGVKTSPTRPQVLDPYFAALSRNFKYPNPFDNALQNMQYRDLFYTKIPRALRFNDRISMMHGTELREPFLDYRLVEMGFAQSHEMKIKNGQGKWLPRQVVKQSLGAIALAPKRPLQTPQREWIGGELSGYTEDSIHNLKLNSWFDAKKLEQEWSNYKFGKRDNSFYIWQFINTNLILK
jgi:asparagine synthase (glutamine-hydrolysing)